MAVVRLSGQHLLKMSGGDDKKSKWKELAQYALNQLAKGCPSSSPTARRDFVAEIEGNRTRFNYLRKQREKGGSSATDTLKDWFKKWIADAEAAKSKRAPADGRHDDGDGWQVKSSARRGARTTSTATSSAGTSATAASAPTSSTSASSSSSPSHLRSGRGDGGGKKEVDTDAWKTLLLAEECPMIDTHTGEEAPRLDPSDAVDVATGYFFCTSKEAANLHAKFARAPNPITLIMPPYSKNTRDNIEMALRKLTDESRLHHDVPIDPALRETTLFVREPTSGTKKTVCALLVHMDRAFPILPPQQVEDGGMLYSNAVPNISMDISTDVDLQFAVTGPMCKEIGLEEWWNKLRSRPFPLFKDDIRKLITSAKWKPTDVRVRRDRRLTWRGEVHEEGKIVAVVRTPREHVDEFMARSGRHGIVIDRTFRDRDEGNADYARVKLPTDATLSDAIAILDGLPPHLKKAAKGIIPNLKGYAIRVDREMEAELVQRVTPEVAAQLGPALGLRTSSSWILRNVPARATREGIIKALSRPMDKWRGWTVIPRRTMGQHRNGKIDWIVDAAQDPPTRSLTVNRDCLMIERYIEQQKTPPKAAPWFKPRQEEMKQMATATKIGGLWSDQELDEEDFVLHNLGGKMDDQQDTSGAMMTDDGDGSNDDGLGGQEAPRQAVPTPKAAPRRKYPGDDQLGRRMRAAGFRTLQRVAEEDAEPHIDSASGEASEILTTLRAMKEANDNKDSIIFQLQETIKGLNAQIAAMSAAMAAMQNTMQQLSGGAAAVAAVTPAPPSW